MSTDTTQKMQIFKAQIQQKIQQLISEFASGAISREQFHAVYERYTGQLALAQLAEASYSPEAVLGIVRDMQPTIAVKEQHMGKAVGMAIYSHRTGTILETLGGFDVPPDKLTPILNDFTLMLERGKRLEREVRRINARQWLVFAAGRYTTVVTLFRNEPSELQQREIERLHHDFELANEANLRNAKVDAGRLAYPFLTFIQRKVQPTE